MATNCFIWVKVNDSDKGKRKSLNKCLIELNEEKYKTPTTMIKKDTEYIGIYVHWDGYIDGVGEKLVLDYNDYKKALNLCLCGYCSTILDYVISYKAWRNECWKYIKPRQEKELLELENYNYVFKDGEWYVIENGELKSLKNILNK